MKLIGVAIVALALALVASVGSRTSSGEPGDVRPGGSDTPRAVASDTDRVVARRVMRSPQAVGAPSPDGRYVPVAGNDVTLYEFTTGTTRQLTSHDSGTVQFPVDQVFSRDGRWIAYNWYRADGRWDLRAVPVAGGTPRVLVGPEGIEFVQPHDWSPDGAFIAATITGSDRVARLSLVSVERVTFDVLKSFEWLWPSRVSFSPDGRYLAYDFPPQEHEPERDLYVIAVDGSRERRVVEHPADDFLMGWAPAGNDLLFGSARAGTPGAWVQRVRDGRSDGTPTLLKPDLWNVGPLGFTTEGSFYYTVDVGERNIYTVNLDDVTAPTPTGSRTAGVGARRGAWSRDGRHLAFVSSRGRVTYLVIRTEASGEVRRMRLDGYPNHPRWSPDGRTILLSGADRDNRPAVMLLDLATGTVETQVHEAVQGAEWSRDGHTIYYKRFEDSRIIARDLATGAERILFAPPDSTQVFRSNWAVSADGTQMVIHLLEPGPEWINRLVVLDLERQVLRDLPFPEDLTIQSGPAWTPDGLHLLFAASPPNADGGLRALYRLPATGGVPEHTGLARIGLGNPRVHPDGRRIVFEVYSRDSELWVLENIFGQPERAATGRAR